MRYWRWIVVIASIILVAVTMLAIADQSGLPWLRICAVAGAPIAVAVAVMTLKTRSQRRSRSAQTDSIEAVEDRDARGGSFLDALILTAAATAVSVAFALPAWILGFGLLVLFATSYWMRRLLTALRSRDAGR